MSQDVKRTRLTVGERRVLADQLIVRYEAGESIRSLAASEGRSYGFIHRLLTESGAAMRGRGGPRRTAASRVA
jgi:hypothetical protein